MCMIYTMYTLYVHFCVHDLFTLYVIYYMCTMNTNDLLHLTLCTLFIHIISNIYTICIIHTIYLYTYFFIYSICTIYTYILRESQTSFPEYKYILRIHLVVDYIFIICTLYIPNYALYIYTVYTITVHTLNNYI